MLDVRQWIGLESIDFSDMLSPDGRAHPLTANTPVSVTSPLGTVALHTDANISSVANPLAGLLPKLPAHALARTVVIVLAIGVLLLAVWRLIKP